MNLFNHAFQKVNGTYARTIVCGDIHGCYDEMMSLLKQIDFCADDIFVCVGDMVDRGPKSWEVAAFFRTTPNAYTVLGNHERRVAGVVRGTSGAAWTQEQTLSSLPSELTEDWAAWFESLPAVIETEHAIIAHAQLDPGKEIENQNHHITSGVRGSGMEITLDKNGIPSWFHAMSFTKPVCIGHIHYDRVELVPNQLYTLDDNCCFGGTLTAFVFPTCDVVSVPAQKNYFEVSKKEWFELPLLEKDAFEFEIEKAIALLSEKVSPSPEMATIITKLSNYIETLDIEGRAESLKNRLIDYFGPLPKAGPDRGKFFIHMKASFSEKQHSLFAALLIRREVFTVFDLQSVISKKKLGDIDVYFKQFEHELAKISAIKKSS